MRETDDRSGFPRVLRLQWPVAMRRFLSIFSLSSFSFCALIAVPGCTSTVTGTGTPGEVPVSTEENPEAESPASTGEASSEHGGAKEPAPAVTSTTNDTPPKAVPPVITGAWVGSAGGDSAFLELEQSGSFVSGRFCEAPPAKDCKIIYGARVVDGRFTGGFSFVEGMVTETASFDVLIGSDGNTMSGPIHVTKCDCELSLVLARAKQ